jgi:hypothetical protein
MMPAMSRSRMRGTSAPASSTITSEMGLAISANVSHTALSTWRPRISAALASIIAATIGM